MALDKFCQKFLLLTFKLHDTSLVVVMMRHVRYRH